MPSEVGAYNFPIRKFLNSQGKKQGKLWESCFLLNVFIYLL